MSLALRQLMGLRLCSVSLGLAALLFTLPRAAWGQAGVALAAGGIGSNATFTMGPGATSESDVGPLADFRPEGGVTTDHFSQIWWWYRVAGDVRERPFGTYTNSAGGTMMGTSSAIGGTANYSFIERSATGGPRFSVEMTLNLLDKPSVPGDATLAYALIISNPSTTQPLNISIFSYLDPDLFETPGNDSAVLGGGGKFDITDAAIAQMGFHAESGASAFQVTSFATLRGLLTDADVDNLDNTGLPFATGNYTGAFQRNLVIAPGSTGSLSGFFGLGDPVPEPASLVLACIGLATLAGVGKTRFRFRFRSNRVAQP